jgi:lysophospholipase L1-like esterase
MALSPASRLRLGLAVLVVALVGSITANALLVASSRSYFAATSAVRLDPAGLKVYADDRAKPPGEGPLLAFFGDSRALMWSPPSTLAGYRVVNRGIGNQTTAQILLRLDADLAPLHPAVVVLEAGVNDLKAIPEFPEKRAEIVADCEANLHRIVDRCRQTGATVVLVSVFGIGDVSLWRRPFWSSDVASAVREVNASLQRLAGDRVVLFDADAVLDDEPGHVRRAYQMDYLHLSGEGYAALNEKLVPLLSAARR